MTHSCQKLIHQEQRLQVCAHLLFPTDLERCFLISFYRKTFSSPGQRTEPWTARWRLVVMAAGSVGSGGSGLCLPLCVEPRPLSPSHRATATLISESRAPTPATWRKRPRSPGTSLSMRAEACGPGAGLREAPAGFAPHSPMGFLRIPIPPQALP